MTRNEIVEHDQDLVSIDATRLDKEWLSQAETVYHASVLLADARADVSKRKAALELLAAQLSKLVRANPGAYDLVKVTEGSLEEVVLMQKSYQEALALLNKAHHTEGLRRALFDALEHKKKALEAMGYLYAQNFYAAPKMPDKDPEMDAAAQRIKKKKGG